jgi:coproporphyrinogen III oxidase
MSRKINALFSRRSLMRLAGAAGLGGALTQSGRSESISDPNASGSRKSLDELTDEQRRNAETMLALMRRRRAFFLDTIDRFNGSRDVETRVFDFDKAHHEVSVARGEVLEKAAWYTNFTKMADPPYVPEATWDNYLELDFHPRTPLLGQLHATIYFTYMTNGNSVIAGYMDYTPGTWIKEDIEYMKTSVDSVFEKYGKDIEHFRKMLNRGYHKDTLQAACIGAAFYLPPQLEINSENLEFVQEVHESFVNAYLDVLEKRKDESFSPEDLENQAGMRKRWLEDHLFSDPFTMYVVPYEVWSFADAPPVVHF